MTTTLLDAPPCGAVARDHVGVEGTQGRATDEPVRGDDAVETGGPGLLVDGDGEVHVARAFGLQSRRAFW